MPSASDQKKRAKNEARLRRPLDFNIMVIILADKSG